MVKNQIKYKELLGEEQKENQNPIVKLVCDSLFHNLGTLPFQKKGTWAIRLNKDTEQLSYKQQLSRLDLLSLQKLRSVIKICKIMSATERVDRDLFRFFFQYKIHQMVPLY